MSRLQLPLPVALALAVAFTNLRCLPVTDCEKYGSTGKESTKSCPSGQQFYGGLCYKACPTGTNRTAACTCDYGGTVQVQTDCGKFANGPCPDGWFKSAACSCQRGGIETNCDKYGSVGPPTEQCNWGEEPGTAGYCYKGCPWFFHHTAACTCAL